jgi:hypothetical protein
MAEHLRDLDVVAAVALTIFIALTGLWRLIG